MALHAIAVHFGRPGTPTDQAWIERFFGHLKAEFPHLLKIDGPGRRCAPNLINFRSLEYRRGFL